MAILSEEEVMGRPASDMPAATAPRRTYTEEEVMGVKPPEARGVLSNATDDGYLSGAAKGTATGVIKGLSHLPFTGMIGDIRELGNLGMAYAGSKLSGRPIGDFMAAQKEFAEAAAKPKGIVGRALSLLDPMNLPSGQELAAPVLAKTGEYKPTSEMGKAGQTFVEGATSGFAGKGLAIPRNMLLSGTGAAAAEKTAEVTGSLPLALTVGVAIPTALNVIPTAVRAHAAPRGPAMDVSAKIYKEAVRDPAAARAAANEKLLPGITPTAGQTDTGLGQLESRLAKEVNLTAPGMLGQNALDQVTQNQDILTAGATQAGSRLARDVQAAYNLTGTAPAEMASTQARQMFMAMEEAADQAQKVAWSNPIVQSAQMYKNKSILPIERFIVGMSPSERQAIPKAILDVIEELKAAPDKVIPLPHVQNLRSQLLSEARANYKAGRNFEGSVNNRIAAEVASVLEDGRNIRFGGMKMGESIPAAWRDAVTATREYHQTYNSGFLQKLNSDVAPGIDKIPLDATFKQMTAQSANARQNLAQMQKATNGQINAPFSDFMVADMTNNGMKLVSPKEVDAFIGKKAALIDMVPGLRDRLISIRDATQSQQISAGLLAADTPEKLLGFIRANRPEINQAVRGNSNEQQYISMLETSANRIGKLPVDKAVPMPTLDKLASGHTSDILYGVATGRIANSLLGYAAVKGAQAAGLPIAGGPMLELLAGALAGNAHLAGTSIGMDRIVSGLLTGNVRERALEILHEARINPQLRQELLDRPTPEKLSALFAADMARKSAVGVPRGIQEYEDRPGRASGGRTSLPDHEAEADRYIAMAERAKGALGRETEPLLKHDDTSIAKALEVANQAI